MRRTNYLLLITTLFLSLLSCGDMDETYRHFWDHGEKVYPAPEKKSLRYKMEDGYINVKVPECTGFI